MASVVVGEYHKLLTVFLFTVALAPVRITMPLWAMRSGQAPSVTTLFEPGRRRGAGANAATIDGPAADLNPALLEVVDLVAADRALAPLIGDGTAALMPNSGLEGLTGWSPMPWTVLPVTLTLAPLATTPEYFARKMSAVWCRCRMSGPK